MAERKFPPPNNRAGAPKVRGLQARFSGQRKETVIRFSHSPMPHFYATPSRPRTDAMTRKGMGESSVSGAVRFGGEVV